MKWVYRIAVALVSAIALFVIAALLSTIVLFGVLRSLVGWWDAASAGVLM